MRGKALERALVAEKVFPWDIDERARQVRVKIISRGLFSNLSCRSSS